MIPPVYRLSVASVVGGAADVGAVVSRLEAAGYVVVLSRNPGDAIYHAEAPPDARTSAAVAAMAGILAAVPPGEETDAMWVAQMSVAQADLLLKELAK